MGFEKLNNEALIGSAGVKFLSNVGWNLTLICIGAAVGSYVTYQVSYERARVKGVKAGKAQVATILRGDSFVEGVLESNPYPHKNDLYLAWKEGFLEGISTKIE